MSRHEVSSFHNNMSSSNVNEHSSDNQKNNESSSQAACTSFGKINTSSVQTTRRSSENQKNSKISSQASTSYAKVNTPASTASRSSTYQRENRNGTKRNEGSSQYSASSEKTNTPSRRNSKICDFQNDIIFSGDSSRNSMFSSTGHSSEFVCREPLSPIVGWRRTELNDVAEITKLIREPHTRDLFGDFDVATIIEHSYISLSQINALGDIVGHIALFDHPNIPAVRPSTWLHWLTTSYKLTHATIRNTAFIHLLVWEPKYTHEFLPLLLESIFINNPYLQNIILVVPPGSPTSPIFEEVFTKTLPPNFTECSKVQTLHICTRHLHVQRLKIRRAVEEDNDDIVPILDKLASNMRVMYGDYYIAEMIQYPSKKKEIIVAEEHEVAIGVTIMSTDINYDLLNEHFELAPFYGLRKEDERDRIFLPELQKADSRDGIKLPVFLQSEDSLSILSCLSVLFEVTADTLTESESVEDVDESSEDDLSIVESATSSLFLGRNYAPSSSRPSTVTSGNATNSIKVTENAMFQWSEEHELGHKRVQKITSIDEMNYTATSTMMIGKSAFEKVQILRIPSYNGQPNAYSIEVFALNEEYDERLTFDFLEAAFEVYPEFDYCILTVPTVNPCFSLLEHFTRVTPRISRNFPNELYVVHRNSVISDLQVQAATRSDQACVEYLLSHVEKREQTKIDFLSSVFYEDSYKSFILRSEGTAVGLAVVNQDDDVEYLRSHYMIENFANFEKHKAGYHGYIKHLVLSPIFHKHTRYFLKEVHRLSELTILYYKLFYNDSIETQTSDRCVMTALAEMLPVLPRRQIDYHLPSLEINRPTDEILAKQLPFALYMMTPRFTSVPKVEVNTRIVVVGASDTGVAFLEALLFGPSSAYLTFNNVTMVSPHGLPGDNELHKERDKMVPYRGRYNAQYMERIDIRAYVNIIYGVMTSINRNHMYIVINDDTSLPYEYLMLFCGEQYQKPLKYEELSEEYTMSRCMHDQRRLAEDDSTFPHNVFLVNTEIDALNALVVLKRLTAHQSVYQIIVYGFCINALCCINALIDFGIPSTNIVFVECMPRDTHINSYFNNKELDEVVQDTMKDLGIKIFSRYYYTGWEMDSKHNRIVKAHFEAKTKPITLECLAMFCYCHKDVSSRTFKALNSAGLVYDGRLVISAKFETNDPRIFAAGSLTKYKRKYYADHLRHCYFNSVEIGSRFDPTVTGNQEEIDETEDPSLNMLTPDYIQPLIVSATLPGGMNYLHVSKPGMVKPLEAAMNHVNYGQVLITGDRDLVHGRGYFRLHLSRYSLVETITCYTKNPIPVDNLICLYGMHERMLNNLVLRFNLGPIKDFFEFFQEPWTCAIFHDRFERVLCDARLQLVSLDEVPARGKSLIETLFTEFAANNWETLVDVERDMIGMKYDFAGHDKILEKIIIDFIDRNSYHLPMYATPAVVRRLLHGINNSEVDKSPLHYVQ